MTYGSWRCTDNWFPSPIVYSWPDLSPLEPSSMQYYVPFIEASILFIYSYIYIYIRSRKNFICAEVLVRIPSDTCLPIVINTDSFFFFFFLFSLRGIEVESKRITVGSKHLSIDYSNCRVHHFCVEKKKNLPPKSHPYVTANSPSRFSIPVSPSPPIPGTTITRRESHVSIVLKANINSKLFKFHGDRGPARRH